MTIKNNVKFDKLGFPSHQISPSEKGKVWHLEFVKAFHREYSSGAGRNLRYALDDYEKYRSYAQGKQDIDQYKSMLTAQRNKGRKDISWRNLDWNILPILPTLVAVVKNKVLGQKKDVLIKAIDNISQTEEMNRKYEILTFLDNQRLMKQAQDAFGVQMQSPLEEGAPMPRNMQEVQLHIDMYPKDRYVMELYDHIDRTKNINNWSQIWDDVVSDLFEVGIAGTKCWIDINGCIRVRRILPEATVTNNCINPDFSDLTRIGEYVPMSISELRAAVPRGTFTEEDYAKMASTASGKKYSTMGNDAYFRTNYRYPYDHEKVMVFDAEWFSADDYAYVLEKSNTGNLNFTKQKNPYWLDNVKTTDQNGRPKVGVSDEEYEAYHREQGSEREVIRDSVNNLYGCKWIVGTHYIFDFGPKQNMQRQIKSLGDCKSNYNLYTFFDSFIRRAEPIADQIQLNWLQHQHHVSQSKPSGLKINKRALTSLSVGGKGGIELDELEMLRMYTETGNFVYKAEDAAGRPYPYDPISELQGGMNEAALQHFELIRHHIDLLRTIFGLNEATDSSTPNPKLGKAIAEMLEQNTNTALGTVYHAYSKLFEDTIKSIATLVPDAEMIKNSARDASLGESSGDFIRTYADMTWKELAITIKDGPTTEVRNVLRDYVKNAQANKEIYPEDAYLIEDQDNIMRAYYMLAQARKKKSEDDMQRQQQQYQMEQEKNINSAMAAEEAKIQSAKVLAQTEIEKAYSIHPLEMEKSALQLQGQLLLEKMKIEGKLDEKDKEVLGRYLETLETVAAQERVARENRIAASKRSTAKKSA